MVARNEAANIKRTIDALAPHVSAYTVCDTGSTDGTPSLVSSTFHKHGLPGRVVHHKWRNFAHNRNLCLNESATHQTPLCDYWLLMDADQTLVSALPSLQALNLTGDAYLVDQRSEGLAYANVRVVTSRRPWKYVGATHEYITAADDRAVDRVKFPANAYVRQDSQANGGDRANKFTRDLHLLLEEEGGDPANARTQFYLGNTYRALGDVNAAIQHYVRRIKLGSWIEEVYMSGYETAMLLERAHQRNITLTGNTTDALRHWLQRSITQPTLDDVRAALNAASNSLPYRVEAHYNVARLHRVEGAYESCFDYATSASLKGPHNELTLFSQQYAVEYGVDDELCVCGYYVKDAVKRALGKQACLTLAGKLAGVAEKAGFLERTRSNLAFYGKLEAVRVRGVDEV